jgi:hypothetical protein
MEARLQASTLYGFLTNSNKVTLFYPQNKIILSRVNKVASTAITTHLLPVSTYRSNVERFRGEGSPEQLPEGMYHLYDSWDGWFSFSFVRNPWDRMVSAYAYLLDHGMNETFEDFVFRHDLPSTSHEIRDHTIPCHFHTHHNGEQMVDFVGRYENFDEDVAKILPKLGKKKLPPVANASQRTSYTDYYSDATRARVAEVFAQDIDLFEYKY